MKHTWGRFVWGNQVESFRFLLIVVALLFSGCTMNKEQEPSGFTLGPGDHDFSIEHDDLTRTYKVHIPPSYDRKTPTPIVLAFHGGGGNAERSVEYFQLNDKSDREGFIVVYLEGTGPLVRGEVFGSWNAGRCCAPAMDNDVDDVGFIRNALNRLENDFSVDEGRVFVTGMSNGAQMSYRLACELADEIAAMATSGSIGSFDNCNPTRPVPVMHLQGTEDPCSPYDGGECGGCMAGFLNGIGIPVTIRTWKCNSIPGYVDEWAKRNKCTDQTEITFQNGDATCITYQECQDDAEVTLCTIEGMGHTWPGRDTYSAEACKIKPNGYVCSLWKDTVGALSDDINANDVMWDFFEKHPMQGDITLGDIR